MASQKQIDANRANALKSTGPNTPAGKAAVSLNALKHGLTSQHAVVIGEDKDQFDELLQSYQHTQQPVGPVETLLVEQMVMAAWRLSRIRGMETGIFDLHLMDDTEYIDEKYENLTPHDRMAYVFHRDASGPNAFTVLARYETRVERSYFRSLHELQRLQTARAKQSQSGDAAPLNTPAPTPENEGLPPSSPLPSALVGSGSPAGFALEVHAVEQGADHALSGGVEAKATDPH